MKDCDIFEICSVKFTADKFLAKLNQSLRDQGLNVMEGYNNELNYVKNPNVFNIRFSRKILSIQHFKAINDFLNAIKKINPKIIHVHTPICSFLIRIIMGFLSFFSKRYKKIKIIYTVHGFNFHENMNFFKKFFFISIEYFLCKFFTHYIFFQSREDYNYVKKKFNIKQNKILHIGNGIDLNKYRFNKNLRNYENNQIRLLYVGRMVEEKGIRDLLFVMNNLEKSKKFKNLYLTLVGPSLSSDRDKLGSDMYNLINKLSNVEWIGESNSIPDIMSKNDIFILPSYREGVPRSVIEAMASGLPCIVTNIRGSRELIEHGFSGFIYPPGDRNSLTNILKKISSIKFSEIEKMGKNAHSFTYANCNETEIVNIQIKYIKGILKKKI